MEYLVRQNCFLFLPVQFLRDEEHKKSDAIWKYCFSITTSVTRTYFQASPSDGYEFDSIESFITRIDDSIDSLIHRQQEQ